MLKKIERLMGYTIVTPPQEKMAQSKNVINWFVKEAFDVAQLNSPQPCAHGSGCDYKVLDADSGQMVSACCRFVHPGEEGNGRRLFPARQHESADGRLQQQPACVRLTGRAGFYERRRLRLSWADWCAKEGIPYTPNTPGEEPPRLVIARIGGPGLDSEQQRPARQTARGPAAGGGVLNVVTRDGRAFTVPRNAAAPRAPAPRAPAARAPAARAAAAPRAPAARAAAARAPAAAPRAAAPLPAAESNEETSSEQHESNESGSSEAD